MPLEKQNKRKTEKREKKHTRKYKGGRERERNDRLDSEGEENKRCSRLLERYLCKTFGEKMIDIQNCSLWQQWDVCHCSYVCRCLPPKVDPYNVFTMQDNNNTILWCRYVLYNYK